MSYEIENFLEDDGQLCTKAENQSNFPHLENAQDSLHQSTRDSRLGRWQQASY
jgi:hypothetical protein